MKFLKIVPYFYKKFQILIVIGNFSNGSFVHYREFRIIRKQSSENVEKIAFKEKVEILKRVSAGNEN